MPGSPLLVSLLTLVSALSAAQVSAPAADPGAPTGTEAALELREEYFVLERAAVAAPGAREVVGFAAWRRRTAPAGTMLQLEIDLGRADARVLHVERTGGEPEDLVWRELRPRGGRTLRAVRADDGARLAVVAWGGIQARRQSFDGRIEFPLTYSERLRHGAPDSEAHAWFDPLAGAPVEVTTTVLETRGAAPDAVRTVALRRADGTLAAAYEFDGEALVGFRWNDGGIVARRVDAAAWESRPRARDGSP